MDELSNRQQELILTKTRVHAEVLLVDHIENYGCNFIDGDDRYIGCSKPACYLCYAHLLSHPGRYAPPASHQTLYIGWRLPDIYSDEPKPQERLQRQEELLRSLIPQVSKDLSTEIESRSPPRPYHADSTAGATTTAVDAVWEARSLENLSLYDNHANGESVSEGIFKLPVRH
jgi:hypothetical protein